MKLSVFADESGQDTAGRLFVVAVVVVGAEHERLRPTLERIERESGKGKRKWTKATPRQRQAYLERVLQLPAVQARIFYRHFQGTTTYLPCVLETVAGAIMTLAAGQPYDATILIDGLQQTERHRVAAALRQRRIHVKKVRGLREESDALMRLADAMAGFVRHALEERAYVVPSFRAAHERGTICAV